MKRRRFSADQIVGVPTGHQTELGATELCRKRGISNATCHGLRSRYCGGGSDGYPAFEGIEAENAELNKILTEQMPNVATLKRCSEKLPRPDSRWKSVDSP